LHNTEVLVIEKFIKLLLGRHEVTLAQHDSSLVHLNNNFGGKFLTMDQLVCEHLHSQLGLII